MKPLKLQNHHTLTIHSVLVIQLLKQTPPIIVKREKMNILIYNKVKKKKTSKKP